MGIKQSKEFLDLPLAYCYDVNNGRRSYSSSRSSKEGLPELNLNVDESLERSSHTSNSSNSNQSYKVLSFKNIATFQQLSLCSNMILKLSPNIGLLKSLVYIQLCCNELKELPREIGHLNNLTLLDLSKNQLTKLPDTIGCLLKLRELKLNNNQLTYLPRTIGNLKKLTQLNLKNNQLKNIPKELGRLSQLIVLDLSYNPIRVLPAEIGQLQYLRKLRLDACPLYTQENLKGIDSSDETWAHKNILSLKEICARAIYTGKVQLEITKLPPRLYHYLINVEKCSFCQGPYFDCFVIRNRWIEKNEQIVPLEYRLCTNHWNNDKERLSLLFCGLPEAMSPQSHRVSTSSTRTSTSSNPGQHHPFNPSNDSSNNNSTQTTSRSLFNLRFSRSMSRLNQPILNELVETLPTLPSLPNYSNPNLISRSLGRSNLASRRSLSIYVP